MLDLACLEAATINELVTIQHKHHRQDKTNSQAKTTDKIKVQTEGTTMITKREGKTQEEGTVKKGQGLIIIEEEKGQDKEAILETINRGQMVVMEDKEAIQETNNRGQIVVMKDKEVLPETISRGQAVEIGDSTATTGTI